LAGTERRLVPAGVARDGRTQEPGTERTVERLEILAPRYERLAKRPVDVLLPGEIDRVETSQRVGNAPRPDFEATLAQHATEDDDVANDGVLARPFCEELSHAR
jgi:hypothetical protein